MRLAFPFWEKQHKTQGQDMRDYRILSKTFLVLLFGT